MPYYRQHGPLFGSVPRPSVPNDATVPISGCKFVSSILCRFTFSLFLLIIALCLFELSIDDESNKNRGSAVIAMILLTVAIISILRTCQTLRRYYIIMNTRRRLIQVGNETIVFSSTHHISSSDCVNDNKPMIWHCLPRSKKIPSRIPFSFIDDPRLFFV